MAAIRAGQSGDGGPVRTQSHVAYRVDSLDAAAAGLPVLLEPFEPLEGVRVVFFSLWMGR